MKIDELLKLASGMKASDLHLKVGNHPYLRLDGELRPLGQFPRISSEIMLGMAFSMMNNRQKQKFKESTDLDMAYGVAGLGRFRVARHCFTATGAQGRRRGTGSGCRSSHRHPVHPRGHHQPG